ncbi:hypothetical protein SS50377_22214 [Spironucleus salmonicida]|uniref:Uncharacterized protein n=1 Tax=Spironucleus salmonicida TaxID=348837 RepID=A0A9P8S0Y4_9EUKA|nr:hypothetical protein SS50377_22214 [Spironucleus salmonicida]
MTDQDQNTKAEAKPTQLTFSSLDNNMNDLLPKIVFQFNGIQFQISEVGDAVCYLKVTIDTVEALSLLHLFMWQHRQGLLLRSDIQLIIIQDDLKDPSISVSEYWCNLASLSLQMGFSTISFSKYNDILLQKPTHQMIIVSDFPRIDSQQLDTMEGLSHFQFDDKMSYSMKLVILERIGLAAHKQQQYAHLLPMILGYSAYIIYNQIIQYQKQDMEILVEDAGYINNVKSGKTIHLPNFPQIYIHHAQEMYTTATHPSAISYKTTFIDQNRNDRIENFTVRKITQVFKNIFELPVHLLNILDFNDSNQFIFQQMCDVSYLFKAQYFAVFSAFFPLENAVLSQSSRSGKTVTLHTIFYFNLFSGLKIPILINTGFTKDSHDLKTQPLYNRGSIEMDQKLKTLFSAYQSQTDLGDVISSNLKDGVEYSKTMAYVKTECFNLIKTYDMHTAQQQLEGAFELYLQGTSVFCEFSVTSMLDFFKFDPSEQLEQTKQVLKLTTKALDDEIQKFTHERDVAKKIIDTQNQEDKSKKQKDIKKYEDSIRAIEQQIGILQQRTDYYATQKTSIQSDNVESYNSNKEVMLLVDECLAQQKGKYALCASALVRITYQFVDKFTKKAKYSIDEILKKIDDISVYYLSQLLDWLEIRQNKLPIDKVESDEAQQYLEQAKQKIEYILGDPIEIDRYFLRLIPSEVFKNCKAYKLIDLMGISSPNFINLRESLIVKKSFQEMMSDLTKYTTLEVFREKLYQFLLMLYNPRGIETIFWRNISFVMNQGADTISSFHKLIEVKDKLNEYLGEQFGTEEPYIKFFKNIYAITIKFPILNVYQEIPFISVKVTHLLAAGTDLALINFLRQNQFLYTSENSRGKTPYTQSNILGTSQMHPSCLTQSYYRDMRITTQTNKSMIEQVNDKVKDMSIKDFYLTMMPELAAELQFLCPLVCPQIIINESATKYLFNSTYQFQLIINSKSILLNQISSHMQIHNSLFIMRNKDLVGANQLINQESKTELLKLQSIAEFNQQLHLTSSSSLNRDVVFVLHFLASQRFLDTLTMLNGESDQAQLSQLCTTGQIEGMFKQQQISEISSAIILVISLCRQYPTHMSGLTKLFKQIIKYSQYLEIYVNPLQVQQNNITTLKEIYTEFQSLFKGAFFMFLQKSFDKYWNVDTPDIDMYIRDAIQNASVCYVKLKQLGLLQKDEKLAIVTITDKTCISNLFFETSPPMPDYLISLFGVEDTIRDSFSNKKMLSIKTHDVDEEKVSSINLLMDSGNHTGEEMFKKQKDTGIATCFQVTNKYQQNFKQICLHHQVSPQYEARTEKVEAYQAQKEVKVLSEVKAKVEQLNNDVAQANDKVEQLKNEVDEAEAELTTAKLKVKELKVEVNQAEAELTTAKLKVKELKVEVNQAEAELTTAKLKVKELKVEVNQAEGELDTAKTKVNQAETELTTAKTKVNQAETELTTAKTKVNQAETELTTAKAKVNQAEAELTTAKLKVKELKVEVNQAEAELTTAKAKASQPNIDAKNIVIQYEKRQEYAMLNAVQEIEKAEKALLYAQYASVSPRKQFNIEQAEIQLQQAKDWQQILTENTNKDNDIEKAAIKAQAEFEMLQAKYDNIIHSQQIKHMAEKVINVNYQTELLTQNQTEAMNMTATAKQRVEDAQTDLTSKQIISKEREDSVNAARNKLNRLIEILKKKKERQSTTQEETTLLIQQASKEFEQVQENAKQPTADTLVATQKHQSAVADQSFVDKMLTCIKGELLLGEKSQKDVQIQIGKQSPQDQVEIQQYMNIWNQAIGFQTPTNESETNYEDVGLSVLDQQLVFDMLELCQLFDQLSQIQLAKESSCQQQILTASKYAALSVIRLTEQYNQGNNRKVLQQHGGATPNQVKVMSKEENKQLQNVISEWCTSVLKKGQQAQIEISDFITQWKNLFGVPQIIVHFAFKVLLRKIKQLLQQLKDQLQLQQNIQDKNAKSYYGTKNTIVANQLQQPEEKQQYQKNKQLFNDKFFCLDIFYFVNCKRNSTSSMFCIDYLRNIENQTVKKIIQQKDLNHQKKKTEEPAKQQTEAQPQVDLEINQSYIYFKFNLPIEAIKVIFVGKTIQEKNNYFYFKKQNDQTIESVLLQATIPIKCGKQVTKVVTKQQGKIFISIIQFKYESYFRQFGNFYSLDNSIIKGINGIDTMWISNNYYSGTINARKFTNDFLFQILEKINQCLLDSAITYKILANEITIKQVIDNKDIIGFLLKNHLFPVSIDGTTLIVDCLTEDCQTFLPILSKYEILCKIAILKYRNALSERQIGFLQKKENEVFDAACKLIEYKDGILTFKVKHLRESSIVEGQKGYFEEYCFEVFQTSKENLMDTLTQLNAVIVAIEEGYLHVIILK